MEGYIKLHRKLLENPICQKLDYLQLWVVLLLKANYKETELMWDGGLLKLKPGELVTGRKSLAKQTGINEYKVERILKYLENTQQIAQQTNNKFRVITIVNWEKYQCDERNLHNKTHNNCTTTAQQLHTDKKDKKDNNDKKKGSSFKKTKAFFQGLEMRRAQNRWWVIPKDGGEWLEFAGKEKDIIWR